MFYSPTGSLAKKDKIMDALELPPKEDMSNPIVIKLSFYNDDYYNSCIEKINNLHNCFDKMAVSMGVVISKTL